MVYQSGLLVAETLAIFLSPTRLKPLLQALHPSLIDHELYDAKKTPAKIRGMGLTPSSRSLLSRREPEEQENSRRRNGLIFYVAYHLRRS